MSNPEAQSNLIRSEFADDSEMTELIEMFVTEMPQRIDSLSACCEEQRMSELQTLAHQLKGSGAGYGFEPISTVAAELESSLKNHEDIEAVRRGVDELIDICQRITA